MDATMMTDDIRQRWDYTKKPIAPGQVAATLGKQVKLSPVKRIDYWEDGSKTEVFYLELSAEQYGELTK